MKLKIITLMLFAAMICSANEYTLVKKECHYAIQPACESTWTRLKFDCDVEFAAIPRILSNKLSDVGVAARVDIVTPCQIDLYASTCGFDNGSTGVVSAIEGFIKIPKHYMNSSAILVNSMGKCLGFLHFTNESGRPFNVESALKRITLSTLQ